ncbi:MAG: DUF2764 family protein [Bacteroidales bacterium]|nr:DUF2764 family protein [Bacteroidales bacterium]
MANYEYIISSLPVLGRDGKSSQAIDPQETISFILSQCGSKDRLLVEQLLRGFNDDALGEDFYREVLGEKAAAKEPGMPGEKTPKVPHNRFIKEYFTFDLRVRNAKVRYLNKALGRSASEDIFLEKEGDFPEKARLDEVLATADILAREKGLDNLMWDKIQQLVTFHYFDIDVILAFIARLHIIDRWLKLDEQTGREMFRRLVAEVKGTFKGVDYRPE